MSTTVTIDRMAASGSITLNDGVFVHDHAIARDARGSWWAYRGGSFMFAVDRDDLLTQIAHAMRRKVDLDDLNGRLARSLARSELRRIDDGNKPPSTGRCPKCGGLGTITKGAGRVTCPTCGGKGIVPTSS